MRYRDFIIDITSQCEIKRLNKATGIHESCDGYFCSVYRGDDDLKKNILDSFTLAKGYEIADLSITNAEQAVLATIDNNYTYLKWRSNETAVNRKNDLIGRLISALREYENPEQMYKTLKEFAGFEDDEIRQSGHKYFVPYFDRDGYAQTIAEFLISQGTEQTYNSGYHIGYDKILKVFGIDMKIDTEMRDKVCECLRSYDEVASGAQVTENGFDMAFHTAYCPYSHSENNYGQTQQM